MFTAGNVVAPLTVDLSPFKKGIGEAKGLAGELKGGLDKVFGGIGSALTSPVAAIAGLAGGLLSVRAGIDAVKSAMSSIDASAKAADQIGITTQAYAGLTLAASLAGVGQEELGMSLRFLQKALADVADGAAPQAQAALDKLGLSGAELANLPVNEALGRIGDKLQGVTNAAERTSIAADLLGMRGGPKLLSLLSQGTAGMQAAQRQAQAYGLALSRVDAAKVEQANDALTNARGVLEGIADQVAVGVAPVIQSLADDFTHAGTAGEGIGPKVASSLEYVASGIAYTTDALNILDAGFETLRAGASYALGSIIDVAGYLVAVLEKINYDIMGSSTHMGDAMQAFGKGLIGDASNEFDKANQAAEAFADGKGAKAVKTFFDEARHKAEGMAKETADAVEKMRGGIVTSGQAKGPDTADTDKITDALARMRAEVVGFGMSDAQKGYEAFAKMKGVGPGQVGEFKALADQLDRLNEAKDLKAKADEVKKAIETPVDAMKARVAELDKLRDRDLLSEQEYQKALADAKGDAFKAEQKDDQTGKETSFASFMKSGSNDVAKLAFSIQRDKGQDDTQKKQLAALDKLVALQQSKDKTEQVATIFGNGVGGLGG